MASNSAGGNAGSRRISPSSLTAVGGGPAAACCGAAFRWQAAIVPYATPNTSDDLERLSETLPARLYRISVDVSFPADNGRERTLSLTTLKLGGFELLLPDVWPLFCTW